MWFLRIPLLSIKGDPAWNVMKKLVAYQFDLPEIEERLQICLDNKNLKLVDMGYFYFALFDSQELDGAEIDERLAQIIGVKSGQHYAITNGLVFLVDE